jgi:Ca-activated chloride channel family protein
LNANAQQLGLMHRRTWRRALVVVFAFGLIAACYWSWNAADRRWANLWRTPDQQGKRLLDRGEYFQAAKTFQDPDRQAAAFYRGGDFKSAAAAWGRIDSATAAFNRGDALIMTGKYDDAISSLDRALALRPDWIAAKENRDLALARKALLSPPNDGSEDTGEVDPDEIVFDNRPKSANAKNVETTEGGPLSDEEVQALWLRRVQIKPADFLRAKFAYQLSRESGDDTKAPTEAAP